MTDLFSRTTKEQIVLDVVKARYEHGRSDMMEIYFQIRRHLEGWEEAVEKIAKELRRLLK